MIERFKAAICWLWIFVDFSLINEFSRILCVKQLFHIIAQASNIQLHKKLNFFFVEFWLKIAKKLLNKENNVDFLEFLLWKTNIDKWFFFCFFCCVFFLQTKTKIKYETWQYYSKVSWIKSNCKYFEFHVQFFELMTFYCTASVKWFNKLLQRGSYHVK